MPALTAAQLAAYTGDYVSDELPTIYHIEVKRRRLLIRARRLNDTEISRAYLRPMTKDQFNTRGCELHFTRDAAGKPGGFALSTSGARGIRFRKSSGAATGR
ncbi:MAG: hypothetical protein GY953_30450 [bacterium]|nr:hypothetical protein [bacterium]